MTVVGRLAVGLWAAALAVGCGAPGAPSPERGAEGLTLSPLVGDGMVLQRDSPVPIRGSASPGTTVTVRFRDGEHAGTADESGRWLVELPASPAGGPWELSVSAGDERIVVRDLLVGDVWLCSGQSNMEWTVELSDGARDAIAGADDPEIRHFEVPRSWSYEPDEELAGGEWEKAGPETVGRFTAVGYFFARALRPHADIPIGLINSSWGGSRIEPWMSPDALGFDEEDVRSLPELDQAMEQEILAELRERIGEIPEDDAGLVDGEPVWADPDLDDSGWETLPVPARWEAVGYPGMDGSAWYRTSFGLTAEEAAGDVVVGVGKIDDSDVTWLNGTEIGSMELAWTEHRRYEVPAGVVREGRNVLAVRVLDTGGGGGILGLPEELWIETVDGRRPLAGDWKFRVGSVDISLEFNKTKVPTVLYHGMIHPLESFPVRGVLWYQGESNADVAEDAIRYRELLPRLIEDWRLRRSRPELPFLIAQLPGWLPRGEEPEVSPWALLRESQSAALELPATAVVSLTDVGDPDDVHPTEKRVVGERLALAARAVVYGEDLVFSGPTYSSHEILADGRVRIEWDHVGGGLGIRDDGGDLRGFAIAGADREFVPAQASIDGDVVVVWNEGVAEPVAVRYAWADDPSEANLVNEEGLPASPFRTDAW